MNRARFTLTLDHVVDIREEVGCVVIEPIRATGCDLAELLAGITPESLYAEVGFGEPVGKEAL